MATGIVQWFNPKKGFGFIVPDHGSAEVFVHYTNIVSDKPIRNLSARDQVEFDLRRGAKGPYALNVRCLSGPE